MLNQVVLVGRLKDEIEWLDDTHAILTLAVSRAYKNENGEYDTDIIKCKVEGTIAKNTAEYCHKGDIIGLKGRVECLDGNININSEKISFLSSHSKDENEEDC